jgi:hypothetical protein
MSILGLRYEVAEGYERLIGSIQMMVIQSEEARGGKSVQSSI